MPISSNVMEPLGNDPFVVYPLGNIPPNFNASTRGNAPSTSSNFLHNSNNGDTPNTSINGSALNNIVGTPLPSPFLFLIVLQKNSKQQKKKPKKLDKQKKRLLTCYVDSVA